MRKTSFILSMCFLISFCSGYCLAEETSGVENLLHFYGDVKDSYDGDSDFEVIHIQDAHCVYEAQKNIAKILDILVKNYDVKLIALEGASDKIETDEFSSFPDKSIRKMVSDYMMKNGRISGSEYYSITSDSDILITGIEDRSLYKKNHEQFIASLANRTVANNIFSKLNRLQMLLENRYYSPQMKRLLDLQDNYTRDRLSLSDYVNALVKFSQQCNVDIGNYDNINLIYEIDSSKKSIKFDLVDRDRENLINDVCAVMNNAEVKNLLQQNLRYKLKQISTEKYHNYLSFLSQEYDIEISEYIELNKFVNYINLYKSLVWNEVAKECSSLLEDLFAVHNSEDKCRILHSTREGISILSKLYQLSLPVDQFEDYLKKRDSVSPQAIFNSLKSLSEDSGFASKLPKDIGYLTDALPLVEEFYKTAQQRDITLMKRFIDKIDSSGAKKAIFVAGGFHSSGIIRYLKNNNISYKVIVPKIHTAESSDTYYSMLSNSLSGLENYLGKSTLAISSWLEQNPLTNPERKIGIGYKMKSLMIGCFTYFESTKDKADIVYLQDKVSSIMTRWGKTNYGDISIDKISYFGPYLNVSLTVNGKNINILLTNIEKSGTARLEGENLQDLSIPFNSHGDLELIEKDRLGDSHFQVITPKGLETLQKYADYKDKTSAKSMNESIRAEMEHRLVEILMTNDIKDRPSFDLLLKTNSISMSEEDIIAFMNSFGLDTITSYSVNNNLFASYLSIQSKKGSFSITNDSLPNKAKDAFKNLGFDSLFVEKDIPDSVIQQIFRQLSLKNIRTTEQKKYFISSDKNRTISYFLTVSTDNNDKVFLKIEKQKNTDTNIPINIDPSIIEQVLASTASTKTQQYQEKVIPIKSSVTGVISVAVKNEQVNISIIELDDQLNLHPINININIDLKSDYETYLLTLTQIQEIAYKQNIKLIGLIKTIDGHAEKQEFFNNFNQFIYSHYSEIIETEVNRRLTAQYGIPIKTEVLSATILGLEGDFIATQISYEVNGETKIDYVTKRIVPTQEGDHFNIGLSEFLEEKLNNLKPSSDQFVPDAKMRISLDDNNYVFVRNDKKNSIHMLMDETIHSDPLSDGEKEFIKLAIGTHANQGKTKIEPMAGVRAPILADTSLTTIHTHVWNKRYRLHKDSKFAILQNDVIPFMINKVFGYSKFLQAVFGNKITVLDLFGAHGAVIDEMMNIGEQEDQDQLVSIDPYLIQGNLGNTFLIKKILRKHGLPAKRLLPGIIGDRENRTLKDMLDSLKKQKGSSYKKPQVITLFGTELEAGIISHKDALDLCKEMKDVLADGGLVFIAGTDYLALQSEDFEKIGFDVVSTGPENSFFDRDIHPAQYYVLRKNEKTKETDAGYRPKVDAIPEIGRSAERFNPAEDILDFIVKINDGNMKIFSPENKTTYGISVTAKVKMRMPDGRDIFVSDISPQAIASSVNNKIYLDIFLTDGENKSLLPVLKCNLDTGLDHLTVDRLYLDSVNINGSIRDLKQSDFDAKIAKMFYDLLPQTSRIYIRPAQNYTTVISLYQTLPERFKKEEVLLASGKELLIKINRDRKNGKPVEDSISKINQIAGKLLRDLMSTLKSNPGLIDGMNKNLFLLSDKPPFTNYLSAGFIKPVLLQNRKKNHFMIELQKTSPSSRIVAEGSLRLGIKDEAGRENTIETEWIRDALIQIKDIVARQNIATESYFKAVNIKVVDGTKSFVKFDPAEKAIILNYDLFKGDITNKDLLLMEVKQGLARLDLQQISELYGAKPLNTGVGELFSLLDYVQSFIDLKQNNPDKNEGLLRQIKIMNLLEQDLDTEERSLFRILRYVHDNNVKNAWSVKNILIDLITGSGIFAGISVYPENIVDSLKSISSAKIVDEIQRIIELREYRFITRSVTRSRTSVYLLNTMSHKEKTIKAILENKDVCVGYLKFQNFKDVFNSFGAKLQVGHGLGDIGIAVIGRCLAETIRRKTHNIDLECYVGNEGPEFFLSFSNISDTDVAEITREILADTKFKENIILEVRESLRNLVGIEKYEEIKKVFESEFTEDKLNFYGGFSEVLKSTEIPVDLDRQERIFKAAQITDSLYDRSFKVAKLQQLRYSASYSAVRDKARAYLTETPQPNREHLSELFTDVKKEAAVALRTGILSFDEDVAKIIEEDMSLGLENEYHVLQQPVSKIYKWYNSLDVLSANYLEAIESEAKDDVLTELKDRILETVLFYKSADLHGEYVYLGNDNFKILINYLIRFQPEFDLQKTFKLGGDEFGKIMWDSSTKKVTIYRFDINNLGATNYEWGMDFGDKMIDESARIISQSSDMNNLSHEIVDFFNDMGEFGIEITEKRLKDIQSKTDNVLVLSEKNYRDLKKRPAIGGESFEEFTEHNPAVVVRQDDGRILVVKFPDIHAPYSIQKSDMRFNTDELKTEASDSSALPITFLAGEDAIDFILLKDKLSGDLILISKNDRAPPKTIITQQEISRNSRIDIPVKGYGNISVSINNIYGKNCLIKGDILILNESQFRKVKSSKEKLVKKDGKFAVTVTTRPLTVVGNVVIDTQKILSRHLSRDFSNIQGRADTASEDAKFQLKFSQVLHNGTINHDLASLSAKHHFAGTEKEMLSFDKTELSFWDEFVARNIIESNKYKLDRRLDYLFSKRSLNDNDLHVLGEIYINDQNILDDRQKRNLLSKLAYSYRIANIENKNIVKFIFVRIITHADPQIWSPALLFFKNKLMVTKNTSIRTLFYESLSSVSEKSANPILVKKWNSQNVFGFNDWIKMLIDTRSVDIISPIKELSFEQIKTLIGLQDKLFPLINQYMEFYDSGNIQISPHEESMHSKITQIKNLSIPQVLPEIYDHAHEKVKDAFSALIEWQQITPDDQNTITSLMAKSRILEDAVTKMFDKTLSLGKINRIRISKGIETNIENSFNVEIELTDGKKYKGIVFNIIPAILEIRPGRLQQYFSQGKLRQYVERSHKINKVEKAMVYTVGDFYEIDTPEGTRHVITSLQSPKTSSMQLMFDISQRFANEALEDRIKNIVKKDITAYMRVWDILGRDLFFQSTRPENILSGHHIRDLNFMEQSVKNMEILNRFISGYKNHTDSDTILKSIISFFDNYEQGCYFLITAYKEYLIKDPSNPNRKILQRFLSDELNLLKESPESSIEHALLVIRLERILVEKSENSIFIKKLLFALDKEITDKKHVRLNHSIINNVFYQTSYDLQLNETQKNFLLNYIKNFANGLGCNPKQELKESLIRLSKEKNRSRDDKSLARLILKIEQLEILLDLREYTDYTNLFFGQTTIYIHPYANPVDTRVNNLGSLSYEDAIPLIKNQLKTKMADGKKQVTISISGRPGITKETLLNQLLDSDLFPDKNAVSLIDLNEIMETNNTVDIDLFRQKLKDSEHKAVTIIYGDNVHFISNLDTKVTFDYNIFLETDEISRVKHLIETNDTAKIKRLNADNILFRWGYPSDETTDLKPQGIDAQRAFADVIIDLSPTRQLQQTPTKWTPELIAQELGLDINSRIMQNLQTLQKSFDGNTVGKQIVIFEPEQTEHIIALAYLGFHVTVVSKTRIQVSPSLPDEYRIKKAGGTINHNFLADTDIADLSKNSMFDAIYLDAAANLFSISSPMYLSSKQETASNILSLLKPKGVIFNLTDSQKGFLENVAEQKNITFTGIENSNNSGLIFHKQTDKDKPAILLENIPITRYENTALQQPFIIAIDFDDIKNNSSQWDIFLFTEVLQRKIEEYKNQNKSIQFAFVSTQTYSTEMRSFLGNLPPDFFILMGKEDIENDTAYANQKFAAVTNKLFSQSRNPLTNVILIESDPAKISQAVESDAIIVDTSAQITKGIYTDQLLGILNYLDNTIINNLLDASAEVTKVSSMNPLYNQFNTTESTPLGNLVAQSEIGFNHLRGLVFRFPVDPQNNLTKDIDKIKTNILVEQSL